MQLIQCGLFVYRFCLQNKYYNQKLKAPTRYKPTKQQYIIQPPNVERTLPNRNESIPRDAVWQKVHSTKYIFTSDKTYKLKCTRLGRIQNNLNP